MLDATGLGPLNNFLLVLNLNVVLNKKCVVRDVRLLSSLRGRQSKAKGKVKEFERVNFSITQPTQPHLPPLPPTISPPLPTVSSSSSSSSSSSIVIYTRNLYMVFRGIVCKIRLKYKKLFDYQVKNTKTYIIIRVTMSHLPRRPLVYI